MSDREIILGQLTSVWDTPRESTEVALADCPEEGDLWAIFVKRLGALGGEVVGRDSLSALEGCRVCFDEDAAQHLPAGFLPTDDPWQADVGVTLADWAIAETGSLLIASEPGRRRLASLCPPRHIALLPAGRLVSTLDDAFARLGDRTAVLITGPSRTADIEGILIRGVHGPGFLTVVSLEEA